MKKILLLIIIVAGAFLLQPAAFANINETEKMTAIQECACGPDEDSVENVPTEKGTAAIDDVEEVEVISLEVFETVEEAEEALRQRTESATPVLTAEITFNWPNMTQIQRDEEIEKFQKMTFTEDDILKYKKTDFKEQYKEHLRDSDHYYNYDLARRKVTEDERINISGFFLTNRILYMYAIQYKDNPKTVYYYDAMGRLQYIDKLSENYPNYPYVSKQYRINGKMAGAIYFLSKDMQHMYNPDQSYKGLWYNENMFDKKGVKILTRTNW